MTIKYLQILSLLLLMNCALKAQPYANEIAKHRQQYKQDFLTDEHSPLTAKDTGKLNFFPANAGYLVKANFTSIKDTIGFDMQTHNGVVKKYFVYGKVDFTLSKKQHVLFIYQSQSLKNKKEFEDYLFIPFTDETNNVETFGGGRYLDFRMKDIFNNTLLIDFNKCYNPYCAYKEGYSCPIPPRENDLKMPIYAGEKIFNLKKNKH